MKNLYLLFTFLPMLLYAQRDIVGQQRMIIGLTNYRNELIARNPEGFKQIYRLDELWKAEDQEQIGDFVLNVTFAYHILGYSAEKIAKKFKKEEPDFQLAHLLTEETIRVVADNDDWMSLLVQDMLKTQPPFKIDPETGLFEELDFYKIQNGMHIAEIGAGDGLFCLLLGLAHDSLSLYVNDINQDAVKYAAAKINRCQSIRESNQYFVVEGKKKSTTLEGVHLDKIIIRYSFHHFTHQPEMLASIRQSLLPSGDLYITEPTIQPNKKPSCESVMRLTEIREALLANGFQIVEEKPIKDWNWVMLHCKPSQGN